ncbi:hypothetical protein EXIGLDRAFT_707081 [Exidia glandulosa HHB12029]|uniref:Uncharacterized protein n=1 Tax=Exidia glandulosa HHB12029 TaxID=1314781 RepID=A0A166AVF8_EXIGL|nr:hypothetical protein EXIGLDRAFT_707081 [Exidia glandulosa HHB12029]
MTSKPSFSRPRRIIAVPFLLLAVLALGVRLLGYENDSYRWPQPVTLQSWGVLGCLSLLIQVVELQSIHCSSKGTRCIQEWRVFFDLYRHIVVILALGSGGVHTDSIEYIVGFGLDGPVWIFEFDLDGQQVDSMRQSMTWTSLLAINNALLRKEAILHVEELESSGAFVVFSDGSGKEDNIVVLHGMRDNVDNIAVCLDNQTAVVRTHDQRPKPGQLTPAPFTLRWTSCMHTDLCSTCALYGFLATRVWMGTSW